MSISVGHGFLLSLCFFITKFNGKLFVPLYIGHFILHVYVTANMVCSQSTFTLLMLYIAQIFKQHVNHLRQSLHHGNIDICTLRHKLLKLKSSIEEVDAMLNLVTFMNISCLSFFLMACLCNITKVSVPMLIYS